jgi:hypothetical protein
MSDLIETLRAMAELADGLSRARLSFAATPEQLDALAALPRAARSETLHLRISEDRRPQVCETVSAQVGPLCIDATRWRPATPDDARLEAWRSAGNGGWASRAETAEALGLPVCPRCREPVDEAGMCAECESAIAIR